MLDFVCFNIVGLVVLCYYAIVLGLSSCVAVAGVCWCWRLVCALVVAGVVGVACFTWLLEL